MIKMEKWEKTLFFTIITIGWCMVIFLAYSIFFAGKVNAEEIRTFTHQGRNFYFLGEVCEQDPLEKVEVKWLLFKKGIVNPVDYVKKDGEVVSFTDSVSTDDVEQKQIIEFKYKPTSTFIY